MKTIKGWFLRQWYRFNKPYQINLGEYGQKGWFNKREPILVHTALSFAELNAARKQLGDLPSQEDLAAQYESMSREEMFEQERNWIGAIPDTGLRRSLQLMMAQAPTRQL